MYFYWDRGLRLFAVNESDHYKKKRTYDHNPLILMVHRHCLDPNHL